MAEEPTSSLYYHKQRVPRDTPYATGITLNASTTGVTISYEASTTTFIERIIFYLLTGCTFADGYIKFPYYHKSGNQIWRWDDDNEFAEKWCKPIPQNENKRAQYFQFRDESGAYLKYELNLRNPVILASNKEQKVMELFFTSITEAIKIQLYGWEVVTDDDGV